jgi:hypothetical protein
MGWLARGSTLSVWFVPRGTVQCDSDALYRGHTDRMDTRQRVLSFNGKPFWFRRTIYRASYTFTRTNNCQHWLARKGYLTVRTHYECTFSGMHYARLGSCQPVRDHPLNVLINATHWIGIYLKIMLDIFVRVRSLRLVYRTLTGTQPRYQCTGKGFRTILRGFLVSVC